MALNLRMCSRLIRVGDKLYPKCHWNLLREKRFSTGHSGAGKSSLLKLIMRDQLATDGVVSVNGVDLASIKDRNIPIIEGAWNRLPRSPPPMNRS